MFFQAVHNHPCSCRLLATPKFKASRTQHPLCCTSLINSSGSSSTTHNLVRSSGAADNRSATRAVALPPSGVQQAAASSSGGRGAGRAPGAVQEEEGAAQEEEEGAGQEEDGAGQEAHGGASGSSAAGGGGSSADEAGDALLSWLVGRGATPADPPVAVRDLGSGRGRGLVATRDVQPGRLLLSVPLTPQTALVDDPDADPELWPGRLAAGLMHRRRGGAGGGWGPWLNSLPSEVDLPWVWPDALLEQLQEPDTIAEARYMRHVMEYDLRDAAAAELAALSDCLGVGDDELAAEVCLLYSRCFRGGTPPSRMMVPGIDMANHCSVRPNATVRFAASPGLSQGMHALEEVADVSGLEQPDSRFELLAGEETIRAGQEVTISYSAHPNDVFLLYFGFCPHPTNPHDSCVLFQDPAHAAEFLQEVVSAADGSGSASSSQHPDKDEGVWEVELPDGDFNRLVVTAEGLDQRLLMVADAALRQQPGTWQAVVATAAAAGASNGSSGKASDEQQQEQEQEPPVRELLRLRCERLLRGYATTAEQDELLLGQLEDGAVGENNGCQGAEAANDVGAGDTCRGGDAANSSGGQVDVGRLGEQDRRRLALAVRYRLHKKRVLLNSIQNLS